jgi:ParB family chromosome partitioning protein
MLGGSEIECITIICNDITREPAKIDENLIREELTVLERAEHLKRRKELCEAKYPETKKGGDKGNQYTDGKPRQSEIISFSQDTANK